LIGRQGARQSFWDATSRFDALALVFGEEGFFTSSLLEMGQSVDKLPACFGKLRAGLSPSMCLVPLALPATTAKPNLAAPSKHRRFATQQSLPPRSLLKKA
jgi:hypothetical protein